MSHDSLCVPWRHLSFCFASAPREFGDGLIIVENPDHRVPGHFPFRAAGGDVSPRDVTIDDQVATTSVDQEFYNPNGSRTRRHVSSSRCRRGRTSTSSRWTSTASMLEAELLPADKARAMYEDIVRKMRDPALLEYAGRDAFKVRIFPIEPHGTKHMKISYTQCSRATAA